MQDLMPQATEAERAIIGGLLFDRNAISRIDSLLTPEHFYNSGHGRIYKAALELSSLGKDVDLITITQALKDSKQLDGIGGKKTIADLADSSVSAANIDQYANLVIEKAKRRDLIHYGHSMVRLGQEQAKPVGEVMDEAESGLTAVTQGSASKKPEHVRETVTSMRAELMQPAVDVCGVPSGFADLDAMTQGFQKGDLILAAARPAMGKTALCEQMAHFVAEDSAKPVVFFSLEMSKKQLLRRTLARESRVEAGRLRTRKISASEWPRVLEALDRIQKRPVFVEDDFGTSISDMRAHARQIKAEHGELGLIVIDYLQLMEGPGDSREQQLSKLSRALKGMAKDLDVPVIALSQLNRGVENRTNKRPVMSDIRESGAIEQDCDLIMMLYRDEYYDPDSADRGIAEVNIVKHRNGPTGTVKLLFESEYTNFLNREVSEPVAFAPKTSMSGRAA